MFEKITAHVRESQFWPWFFRVTQLASLLLFTYWCWHIPVPGYAIAVLAVLAAVMSLHIEAKMQWWEKATWMLLMGAFLVLELAAIRKDRCEQEMTHSKELAKQDQASQTTINAILNENQKTIEAIVNSADFQISASDKRFDQALNETRRAIEPFTPSDLVSAQLELGIRPQDSIKPYTDRVNPLGPNIDKAEFELMWSGNRTKPSTDSNAELIPQPGKESDRPLVPLLGFRGYKVTLNGADADVKRTKPLPDSSTGNLRVTCSSVAWRISNTISIGKGLENEIVITCKSEKLFWTDIQSNFTSYKDFNGAHAKVKLRLPNSDDLEVRVGSLALTIFTNKGRILTGYQLTGCPQKDSGEYCGWFMEEMAGGSASPSDRTH